MALTDKGSTGHDAMTGWLRSSAGLLGDLRWRQVPGGLSNITCVVTDETGRRVVAWHRRRVELLATFAADVL